VSRNTGIEIRHEYACSARTAQAREAGIPCRCKPAYQANVWSRRDRKRIRRTFPTLSAAKDWRSDALVSFRRRTMRAASPITVREAADSFIAGAKDGTIRNRKKQLYKPSVVRAYEQSLRDHILPALGAVKLADVQRPDLQDLADRLLARGLDPSTIRNAIAPVRVIFRSAISRGELSVNPTSGLELAAPEGKRERIASPDEATDLLGALPVKDRVLWVTALYAGLRRGELMALRLEDIDLAASVIRVDRSYDPKAHQFIEPKSRAGKRTVPIAVVLRD
jgi:integrase